MPEQVNSGQLDGLTWLNEAMQLDQFNSNIQSLSGHILKYEPDQHVDRASRLDAKLGIDLDIKSPAGAAEAEEDNASL